MSLARALIGSGVACGLTVNAYTTQTEARSVYVAPSATSLQVARIADHLADISRWPSVPFATQLHQIGRRIPPTTSVLALSARDSDDYFVVLRRMAASGRDVRVAAHGRHAPAIMARARAVGLRASNARLEPSWRTANALEMVG
jgi:hypothetical protein